MGFGKREGSHELLGHCLKLEAPPSREQHSGICSWTCKKEQRLSHMRDIWFYDPESFCAFPESLFIEKGGKKEEASDYFIQGKYNEKCLLLGPSHR